MTGDLIALDHDDRGVMMIEVEPRVSSASDFDAFLSRFDAMSPPFPFGMFVDLEEIRIVRRPADGVAAPPVRLKTMDVLQYYDPRFADRASRYGSPQIFRDYVETLVESWVRDVAFQWKSETPPGFQELSHIGLAQRLQGGMTRRHVTVTVSPLC